MLTTDYYLDFASIEAKKSLLVLLPGALIWSNATLGPGVDYRGSTRPCIDVVAHEIGVEVNNVGSLILWPIAVNWIESLEN